MRHLLAAAILASLLAPAAAFAQPSVSPAADPDAPPQTNDWNDVSHINGQLVPVGETNSYLKKFRRTNVSSNPIGWMTGFYGLSVSYGLNNHVAIRGDVNFYHIVGTEETGQEIGVGAPLYLRRTYQGPFVEPGFIVRSMQDNSCDGCSSSSETAGPQMLFGWHWTWDSGFNVAAAFGAGRNLKSDQADDLFVNGYFRVGYAF